VIVNDVITFQNPVNRFFIAEKEIADFNIDSMDYDVNILFHSFIVTI